MSASIGNFLIALSRMSTAQFALLFFAVGAGYYYFFFDSGARYDIQFAKLNEDIQKEQRLAEQTRRLLAERDEILQARDQMLQTFETSSRALPQKIDVAELVRGINRTAKSAGAKINGINPSRIEQLELYDQLPINIEAEGSFTELTLFLSYVARMPRIVRIEGFRMEQQRDQPLNRLVLEGELLGFRASTLPKEQNPNGTRRRR